MSALNLPIIAGNWKMHKGPVATAQFFERFISAYQSRSDRTIIFFPPAVSIEAARSAVHSRNDLNIGVQNVHWEKEGAFTGETSAAQAREAGAAFALIGHSERRHLFGETDDEVRAKVSAALSAALTPMICVGETLDEREGDRVADVILRQLDAAVAAIPVQHDGTFIIAYEPVWAIGTGVTATPADASAAHAILKERLAGRYPGRPIPVLYGGSVKPENAEELLAAAGVDGLLVGGASLDPEGFSRIANSPIAG